ncbi:hypothetical protein B0T17DRAFT_185095 [Bombardia bombarda]|uniref:Uncharacterized protein n=1 Tax=Bombardia bombarda TaxID=252184 RepID=A0AA39X8Q4_9PEZI|nr:hypothetical protein B0T17DRAFT_185095 [Bombardia bombarda]
MTPPTGILGAGISVDNHGSGAVGCTVVHKSNSPDSCDRDGLVFRTPYEKALQASCPTDLDLSPILQSKSFHIIGTPSTFIQCLDAIIDLRHEHRIVSSLPPIIWQPAPSGCHNTEIIQHMQNCRHIDVFSPTSIELWSLVEFEPSEEEMHLFSRKKIEQMAEVFVSPGIGKTGGHGVMVIRCVGRSGSLHFIAGVLVIPAALVPAP